MKALVVDDSRAIRELIANTLRGLKFDVVEAPDGQAALEQLQADPTIELALVDWHMPGLNGLELVQIVHADDRFKRLRVMMITTERSLTHVAAALRAGVDEYLTKPCKQAAIVDRVRAMGFPV